MKCPMKNNSDYDIESHKDLIDSLYSHAHQELGFKKPPMLIFQSDPRNYGALWGKQHSTILVLKRLLFMLMGGT